MATGEVTMDCDFDNPCKAVLSDEIRKCRKPRKCCECGTMIERGEHYHFFSGVWEDSGFDSFSTCARCQDLRNRCEFTCAGFGQMYEAVSQTKIDLEVEAFLSRRFASAGSESWIRKKFSTAEEYIGMYRNIAAEFNEVEL